MPTARSSRVPAHKLLTQPRPCQPRPSPSLQQQPLRDSKVSSSRSPSSPWWRSHRSYPAGNCRHAWGFIHCDTHSASLQLGAGSGAHMSSSLSFLSAFLAMQWKAMSTFVSCEVHRACFVASRGTRATRAEACIQRSGSRGGAATGARLLRAGLVVRDPPLCAAPALRLLLGNLAASPPRPWAWGTAAAQAASRQGLGAPGVGGGRGGRATRLLPPSTSILLPSTTNGKLSGSEGLACAAARRAGGSAASRAPGCVRRARFSFFT